ncbi:hypothetical protein BDR03DRAFT_940076 [Suillus americanus]|nr:hypothetical protein BDR03DRAFT_940076 [Suillus americanus]
MEIKQVIATLIPRLHVSLPTEPNLLGHVKEIVWKLRVRHTPVVRPPADDGVTSHPLNVRLVMEKVLSAKFSILCVSCWT